MSGLADKTKYVDYDGVRRAIIHRNPPLIDEEGYEIDSGDDEDRVQDAEAAAAETNPYANIRLERKLDQSIFSEFRAHQCRYPCSFDCVDRSSQSSNTVQTFHHDKPQRTCQAKSNDYAEGESLVMEGQTPPDGPMRGLYLGAV